MIFFLSLLVTIFLNLLKIILISHILPLILSWLSLVLLLKSFSKLCSAVLLPDVKRAIIRSSFVNFSMFLILLSLTISFNPSIDFLCSFSTWFNSFSEIFCNLVIFSSPILDSFLCLRLLSCLLSLFINFLVDRFWGSFLQWDYIFLWLILSFFMLYQDKKKLYFWKK